MLTNILLIAVLVALLGIGGLLWRVLSRDTEDTAQADTNSRLDQLSGALEAIQKQTNEQLESNRKTLTDNLGNLNKNLAVIETAQKGLTDLSTQVGGLQNILDNKQARGQFGETILENLVRDMMPADTHSFQKTLSNGSRVDCLINVPAPTYAVPIDSKFPLDAYRAWHTTENETEKEQARKQWKNDIKKHRTDIASRYLIERETASFALMFLPSESIFADLNINMPEEVEACRKAKVYPVSPNTLAMVLGTIRAIIIDSERITKMQDTLKLVQLIVDDTKRLDERVEKLRKGFETTNKAISEIETSSRSIASRGERVGAMSVAQDDTAPLPPPEENKED